MTFFLAGVVPLSSPIIFLCRQFSSTPFQRFGQRHLQLVSRPVPSVSDAIHRLKRLGARANHSPSNGFCDTEPDKWYKEIERSLWPGYFKTDAPWGFVLYRTCYGNEEAWRRMVREIQAMVKPDPELPSRDTILEDRVLARHDLVLMDDRARFDGATSHELRDHFVSWVVEELPRRLHADEVERVDWDAIRQNERYDEEDAYDDIPNVYSGAYGARYDFCLFVDDICLESLDHMDPPVVKILRRDWGHLVPEKRGYAVYPGFEDGRTAEHCEDVGWMYIDLLSYMEYYVYFSEEHTFWDSEYSRPPTMMWKLEDRSPGFWRK